MRSPRHLYSDLKPPDSNRAARKPDAQKPIRTKPRYVEVSDQLELAILTGKYPVATLLPSESELRQEFAVSRHTVREAVRRLELRGLVSRQQGRGTRVEADRRVSRSARLLGSLEEVERHGRDTHLVNIRTQMVRADAALASFLPCETGESLLRIESYREPRDASTPWPRAWNETYIRERYASVGDEIAAWPGAVYTLVERRFGERVTAIRQEVAALNLSPETARRLKVKGGVAGLRIKRTYLNEAGDVLLYGLNTYVGSQFELMMDIRTHG